MGIFAYHNFELNITPPLPPDVKISVRIDPAPLRFMGMNIPVEISTAAVFRVPPNNMAIYSVLAMAHLDTGASISSIDINLAKHLRTYP